MSRNPAIRVGIGGWTFAPWRGTFYPAGLTQKRELEFASRHVTAIEINGTFYGTQKPESFARWHDETPDDFVFALKGPRYTTNRRVLAEAGASVERFLASGLLELKHKLGPINWQFPPTKQFDAGDFEAFLKLLPPERDGHALRHVVEVRHASFACPACIALLRAYGIGAVITDNPAYPHLHDLTAPFVYARLQCASADAAAGYPAATLDLWAAHARAWAAGKAPAALECLGSTGTQGRPGTRCFRVYDQWLQAPRPGRRHGPDRAPDLTRGFTKSRFRHWWRPPGIVRPAQSGISP
ncbi:MAG: DUF72 domain-containing protein [Acetobacteraceae bacterium]|nr:DUF72 domain-containing protein [Acetobacteraceae bacterium]